MNTRLIPTMTSLNGQPIHVRNPGMEIFTYPKNYRISAFNIWYPAGVCLLGQVWLYWVMGSPPWENITPL